MASRMLAFVATVQNLQIVAPAEISNDLSNLRMFVFEILYVPVGAAYSALLRTT